MLEKPIYLIRLAVIMNTVTACAFTLSCAEPRRGQAIETWETANNSFKIRVTVYAEGNGQQYYQRGAHYSFESAPSGSESWNEFFVPYLTQRSPIPREHVRFANNRVGYVFWNQSYLVTTDSGITWTSWSSAKHLSTAKDVQCCVIEDVSVLPDGKGVMKVHSPGEGRNEILDLRTQDYGQHWER